jgi:hypothetical protein
MRPRFVKSSSLAVNADESQKFPNRNSEGKIGAHAYYF